MATKEEVFKEAFTNYGQGKLDEAIDGFKKVIELDSKHILAHSALAEAYSRNRLFDEAIEAAKKWIELDPNDGMAHTSLSRYYQQKGMIPEAEAEAMKAMQLQQMNR